MLHMQMHVLYKQTHVTCTHRHTHGLSVLIKGRSVLGTPSPLREGLHCPFPLVSVASGRAGGRKTVSAPGGCESRCHWGTAGKVAWRKTWKTCCPCPPCHSGPDSHLFIHTQCWELWLGSGKKRDAISCVRTMLRADAYPALPSPVCLAFPCPSLPFPGLPCSVLPGPVLPFPFLPCPALSGPACQARPPCHALAALGFPPICFVFSCAL